MSITQIQVGQYFASANDWDERAKGLQEQYPLLSDNDVKYEQGKENEMICRIETRLNKSRSEVIVLVMGDIIRVE